MKRKTTDLEQKLISKGYYLVLKHYCGRTSQKTLSYQYVQGNTFITLDSKREKVTNYGLLNYHAMQLGEMELQGIKMSLDALKNDIKSCATLNKPLQTWCFETKNCGVPPSEMNEQDELGAMTPEELDQLCQEHEQDKEQEIIDHIKSYEGE